MVMIVALSMVCVLASEPAAAESTAGQAKLLERLLERMEEQDKKIVELNEKVIFKIARLDANYRDGLSAKDKELAAQAKEIAALREGDTEREAQIATLRERLQAKIAASRVARKAEESQEKAAKAKEWREEKKKAKAERKRKEKADAKASGGADGLDEAKQKRSRVTESDDSESDEDASNLQFGRVEVEGKVGGPAKKKRASKEALLKKALAQRREIEDAGGEDTAAGKKVAERYSWDAALARAGGEKVLDDPKLLQKSVKNEQRMKKKSAEKWAARVDRTEEQMAAKQKKRKDSLKSRANAKVEKRIEKREKKRNRPGFEGRSQAPINA